MNIGTQYLFWNCKLSCYVKFECKHICMHRYLQLLVTSSHYNQVLFYAQCKFRSDFVSIKMYCCNLWSQINIIDSLCLSVRCVFTIKCFVSRIICISSLVWNLLNFDYSCSSNIIYFNQNVNYWRSKNYR